MFGLRARDQEPFDPGLPEHLRTIHTGEWLHYIARLKMPAGRKAVAVMLASFADVDGSNVRPAMAKLGAMAGLSEGKARAHVQALEALGWVVTKIPGGGRHNPTVYRLTRPADISTVVFALDPDMRLIAGGAGYAALPAETLPETEGNPAADDAAAQTETLAETDGNRPETLSESEGFEPVDNSGPDENPSVSESKPLRFGVETLPVSVPDLTMTRPRPTDLGSPQASTSLAPGDLGHPTELARIVADPMVDDPWTPDAETTPAAPGPDAGSPPAERVLADLPDAGAFLRRIAAVELRGEGEHAPSMAALADRAAEILRRSA